jgi:hypothetical protein
MHQTRALLSDNPSLITGYTVLPAFIVLAFVPLLYKGFFGSSANPYDFSVVQRSIDM